MDTPSSSVARSLHSGFFHHFHILQPPSFHKPVTEMLLHAVAILVGHLVLPVTNTPEGEGMQEFHTLLDRLIVVLRALRTKIGNVQPILPQNVEVVLLCAMVEPEHILTALPEPHIFLAQALGPIKRFHQRGHVLLMVVYLAQQLLNCLIIIRSLDEGQYGFVKVEGRIVQRLAKG